MSQTSPPINTNLVEAFGLDGSFGVGIKMISLASAVLRVGESEQLNCFGPGHHLGKSPAEPARTPQSPPAAHVEDGARDVGGPGGTEPDDRLGDLRRKAGPTHRDRALEFDGAAGLSS